MVVVIRAHFHFSFLIGCGGGTHGIKLNVTFFTPLGLRRNNSRPLPTHDNIFTPKESGRKNGGFHKSTFPLFVPNRGWRRNKWNKLKLYFFTPVGLRRNNSLFLQIPVNPISTKLPYTKIFGSH